MGTWCRRTTGCSTPWAPLRPRHKGCDALLRGWCSEDDWERHVDPHGRHMHLALTKRRGQFGRWREQLRVLEPYLPEGVALHDYCPWTEPHTWAKAQHVEHLGDWAQHTWSCRRPKANRPCGECFSCHAREAALRGASAVTEVQDELRAR